MLIIRTSEELNLLLLLPVIIVVFILLLLQFLFRKTGVTRFFPVFVAGFGTAALLFSTILPSGGAKDEPEFTHYLEINKCGYFVTSSVGSLFRSSPLESAGEIIKQIEKYQSLHPEFNFIGNNYPLFHKVNTPDVLGPFSNCLPVLQTWFSLS